MAFQETIIYIYKYEIGQTFIFTLFILVFMISESWSKRGSFPWNQSSSWHLLACFFFDVTRDITGGKILPPSASSPWLGEIFHPKKGHGPVSSFKEYLQGTWGFPPTFPLRIRKKPPSSNLSLQLKGQSCEQKSENQDITVWFCPWLIGWLLNDSIFLMKMNKSKQEPRGQSGLCGEKWWNYLSSDRFYHQWSNFPRPFWLGRYCFRPIWGQMVSICSFECSPRLMCIFQIGGSQLDSNHGKKSQPWLFWLKWVSLFHGRGRTLQGSWGNFLALMLHMCWSTGGSFS